MSIKYAEEYRDPEISRDFLKKIKSESKRPIRLMEVCGTHTMSIFRSGIRQMLPENITLLSGPGCPVCVTSQREIDEFIAVCRIPDVIVTTFGDLLRVPGTESSLQSEKALGADVRVVYSTFDAIEIAQKNPQKKVVFLGVGFETTAPTIAAAISASARMNLKNFFVISAHKLVPPALEALAGEGDINVDGFLLPGHVSVIIGMEAYRPFFDKHRIASVVAGFEPADILGAIYSLLRQIEREEPKLENGYPRAVTDGGNVKAKQLLDMVFEVSDAQWRGIGTIGGSGLSIRKEFAAMDARRSFSLKISESREPKGCGCGEVLKGIISPPQCALYKKACTPISPVGPCMVSSEGTCAAYYRYHD